MRQETGKPIELLGSRSHSCRGRLQPAAQTFLSTGDFQMLQSVFHRDRDYIPTKCALLPVT